MRAAPGEKMSAILPVRLGAFGQAQVGLVHQRGRLQSMVGSLAAHINTREPAQLFVNQRRDFIQLRAFPVTGFGQQICDLSGGR